MTTPDAQTNTSKQQPNGSPQSSRRQPRSRPAKSLPTDRMKIEAQQRVLVTIGKQSGTEKRTIDATRISQAMNREISHYTVGLSNGFFVDAGWLEKRGRGDFAASDSLLDYVRRLATDKDNTSRAVMPLRDAAVDSWFWKVVKSHLTFGEARESELLGTLMHEAGASPDHLPQLRTLLAWLEYIELIERADGRVRVHEHAGGAEAAADDSEVQLERRLDSPSEEPAHSDPPPTPQNTHGAGEPSNTVPRPGRNPADTLLAFDFSCCLTADDLAKLSAGQIQALFAAVGTVMSLTGARGAPEAGGGE